MSYTPTIERIPVRLLTVDHEVQRDLELAQAKAIGAAWDDEAAGVLIVSARSDGTYRVIDGQTRAHAKRLTDPHYEFTCMVLRGLTLKREAELFGLYNDKRKAVHPADIFRISVVAEDVDAVAINRIVRNAGLEISKSAGATRITAVRAVEKVYGTYGPRALSDVLGVLKSAWPVDKESWNGQMFKAVAWCLVNKEADSVLLSKAIGTGAPTYWTSKMPAPKARQTGADQVLGEILMEAYRKTKNETTH